MSIDIKWMDRQASAVDGFVGSAISPSICYIHFRLAKVIIPMWTETLSLKYKQYSPLVVKNVERVFYFRAYA